MDKPSAWVYITYLKVKRSWHVKSEWEQQWSISVPQDHAKPIFFQTACVFNLLAFMEWHQGWSFALSKRYTHLAFIQMTKRGTLPTSKYEPRKTKTPSNNRNREAQFSSVQFSSVAQLCLTLCDPMNCTTPGIPVHHQLPEFTQTQVHRVGDAIQPSHPLSSPFLPPIPPSIRVFSNESTLRIRWPKYWSFSFSIIPSKEHPGLISFRMDWLDLLAQAGHKSSPSVTVIL